MIWTRLLRYFVATGYDRLEAVERASALKDLYDLAGVFADGTRV